MKHKMSLGFALALILADGVGAITIAYAAQNQDSTIANQTSQPEPPPPDPHCPKDPC